MRRTLALAALAVACSSGPPGPVALDTKNDACAWCRMAISEPRFAGQLVAPSEEPKLFDDIGCLEHYLRSASAVPPGAVAFVADHRTKAWVRASAATYTRVESMATPMGSHLMAHTDAASRDADPDARGGAFQTLAQVFGPSGPPGGGS